MPDHTTLIVTYLPRGERSKTKLLVDAFKAAIPAREAAHVEHLDLLIESPGFFTADTTIGYIHRNYMGEPLTPAQAMALVTPDRMVAQLKRATHVVLACPMWNFSVPAAVKAWFDNVMLKGETWEATGGKYAGTMGGRKAMILMAAGGIYESPPASAYDHAMSLAKSCFGFMGYSDVRAVWLGGANDADGRLNERLTAATKHIDAAAAEWYAKKA